MERGGTVYILTNKNNNVLYTGVTSDLKSRILEHSDKKYPGSFTARYNLHKLVYFKNFHNIEEAIAEEKRIKAGSRKKKIELIEAINPKWENLVDKI